MKALILRPKIQLEFEALMPEEIGEKWVCFPALGGLYVREYARKAGFSCDYLDAEALEVPYADAAKHAADGGYDVVGIPADTYSFLSSVKQAKAVRQALPEALIVCGGVHPTIYPEQTAALSCFDVAVFGDAEEPFVQMLKAIRDESEIAGLPGLAVKKNGRVITGPVPEMEKDLDKLGYPDPSDLRLDRYWSSLAKARPVLPLVTSRGCPFRCTFCDRPKLTGKVRYRSADHVVQEMEHLISIGVTEYSIYDDTFTANKKRAIQICSSIKSLPKKVGFDIRSRVDTTDREMLDALVEAGCERVYIGVETGDPDIQKKIKKNIDLEKARGIFKMVQKRKMKALAYFMVGLPGEDKQQTERTIEYAASIAADYYLFEVFVPMPATEAYDDGIASGVLPGDYWAEFAKDPEKEFSPPLWEEKLSRDQLAELIRIAYKRCYLTPGYIWRSLLRTATWEELRQKIKGGLSFLRLFK